MIGRLPHRDPVTSEPPMLWLRAGLIADGYDDGALRRRRRAGELAVVRRGAYCDPTDDRVDRPSVRHQLLIAAARAALGRDAVVSHQSAAVLHGLPVWGVPLSRVHLTRAQRSGGRVGRTVHLHTAPLSPADVVEVDGMPVTSVARTVIDMARTASFDTAVVIADAALRCGAVADELAVAARATIGWRGAVAARQVAAFADGASESVGESRGRAALRRYGLPPPTLQYEVRDHGRLIGRCDYAWPEHDLVGEFDGRVKYGRALRPGQDLGDVVFEEKVREDEIRAAGYGMVRWIWRDLDDFTRTACRIRRALRP